MKRLVSIFLSVLMFITIYTVSFSVSGATKKISSVGIKVSGSCGKFYWEINDDGVFTISGSGAMDDFITETAHWYEYDNYITKVIIGDGITRIGSHAFDGCYNIISVSLSNSVESIGNSSFKDCSHMTEINIPDSVKSIEAYAFKGCSSIENLSSKAPVKIYEYAFYKCNLLHQVYLPDSKEIGSYAFSECPSLNKADFGSGTLNSMVFGTSNLSVKSVVAGSLKTKALYKVTTLELANIINAKYIDDYAVYGCKNLTSINSYAKTIGKNAFEKCSTVKEIRLPQVVTIKDYACYNLYNLETLELGKVESVGRYAFTNCTSLKKVTGTSKLTKIGDYAFSFNTSLPKITVSKKLTVINDGVFANCKNLTGSFDFSNVTSVGYDAFANCQKLSSKLNFTKVKIIWDDAFIGCKNIKGNTLGKSLTGVGHSAFVGCKKIKSLYFPPSCKYIGNGALSKELISLSLSVENEGVSLKSLFVENGSRIKIYCNVDSKAHKYAIKNGIDFGVAVKSISTDKKIYKVKKNKTVKIKVAIKPKYASYKYLSFTSSNKKVATVNSKGKVKGIGKGKCTITLKSKDGSLKTKKVTVTVK